VGLGHARAGDDQPGFLKVLTLPQPIKAIAVRQPQVEQNDIEMRVAQALMGFMQTAGCDRRHAIELQKTHHRIAQIGFILHHQHPRGDVH